MLLLNVSSLSQRWGFHANFPAETERIVFGAVSHSFVVCRQLDSKETYAYTGLRAERCCPWCRLRKGRSAFRDASPHDTSQMLQLWSAADSPIASDARRSARAKLQRYGWHSTRRCGLLGVASACLLPGPTGGGPLRGVIGVDVLHGIYTAWTQYLFDTLRTLLSDTARKALDASVGDFVLRDPVT